MGEYEDRYPDKYGRGADAPESVRPEPVRPAPTARRRPVNERHRETVWLHGRGGSAPAPPEPRHGWFDRVAAWFGA
jgi:hypothetical protein